MHLPTTLLSVLAALSLPPPIHSIPAPHQNPLAAHPNDHIFPLSSSSGGTHKIPSRHTSTLLARRLLALSPSGSLSTIFPPSHNLSTDPAYRFTPDSVGGAPIALPEYIADCEGNGDPTLIMLDISTAAKNAREGRNVSLAVDWWAGYERVTGERPGSAAALPRVALLGWLQEMGEGEVEKYGVKECFFDGHRDARGWEPGARRGAHSGRWVRLRVEGVYWVGGFGDRAWIGWLDLAEWKGVSEGEWRGVRLPGEGEKEKEEELDEL
ncbi:uncharacterized protein HMPREF1541_04636 [Cyphellophora europaea CBS 101466]|uniref:CREG-like beta-barrel domain-containing protein n=1 Tax=Cyphellophora europaea (strain CBS 101466) TaxID=1220924 RepID=W2RXE3_CYPE1|nr:uncharacterized protein HMPREF1541_04636 [Cyphellophora europaea CBS 101466]ETN40359.1 hypothetical protein HMPREF1541_04636 [Cyphellophora europaea CBS 101466]